MTFYKNPLIGWYLKKRLKKVIALLVLCIFFYFIFLHGYSHEVSYGCRRNDCESSKCTGFKCRASGCNGDNCKGGDCIGEDCEAGDCKGVGCRAGDCYGLNCVPGECIDPTCQGERLLKNKCTPFCKNGKGYAIPRSNLYPFLKKLPRNTFLNPDYCSYKKRTNHIVNGRKIHNFKVDYINLYTSGQKKFEDVKYADAIQDGKTYILTSDINFISTTPDIYKNYNCEWSTQFKNQEISSDFKPLNDEINEKTTWIKKSDLSSPLQVGNESNGKEQPCRPGKTHEMIPLSSVNVFSQINSIKKNRAFNSYMKNWMIEKIQGEKLETICNNCNKMWYNYLDVASHPTNLDGSIIPCKVRVYGIRPVTKGYDTIRHDVTSFSIYDKQLPEYQAFLESSVNVKKTFRDHHLWTYKQTIGNNQIYSCYWCNQIAKVEYKSLPRDKQMNLLPCTSYNDYNHYMYDLIDNNKTIYQKCLKCEKKSYPYQQKNI